jgi:hypothetical protein
MEGTAYAKLLGQTGDDDMITKFITSYPVKLGRTKEEGEEQNRIQIGTSKSISREHAEIDWNPDTGHFEIKCLGKNGITVNQMLYKPDNVPAKLTQHSAVKIGDSRFYILLPKEKPKQTVLELVIEAAKLMTKEGHSPQFTVREFTEKVAKEYEFYRGKDQKSSFERTARSAVCSKKGLLTFKKHEQPKPGGKGKLVHWEYCPNGVPKADGPAAAGSPPAGANSSEVGEPPKKKAKSS